MRGMVRLSSNFFWDTLDMYRNHWNGFQAGTLQHPTWPIDTRGLLSTRLKLNLDVLLNKMDFTTKPLINCFR